MKINKISTYLNFALKQKKLIKGISSIVRNKDKIRLIIQFEELGHSSQREIDFILKDETANLIKLNRSVVSAVTTNLSDVKVIAILDEAIANAINNLDLEVYS